MRGNQVKSSTLNILNWICIHIKHPTVSFHVRDWTVIMSNVWVFRIYGRVKVVNFLLMYDCVENILEIQPSLGLNSWLSPKCFFKIVEVDRFVFDLQQHLIIINNGSIRPSTLTFDPSKAVKRPLSSPSGHKARSVFASMYWF